MGRRRVLPCFVGPHLRCAPLVSAALTLPEDGRVHEIVRVRFASHAPVVLEHSYFPEWLCPGMLENDLTGSLYRLLAERYQLQPQSADVELRPAYIDGDEAELMQMKRRSLVQQHILRTARAADRTPVEYSEDLFRTDLIRIVISGQMLSAAD